MGHIQRGISLFLVGSLCIFASAGCMEKTLKPGDERVIEKSEKRRPKWTRKNELESASYFYAVRSFRSNRKTPSYAYKKARKAIHDIFEEDANFLLLPINERSGKGSFSNIKERFMKYVSKKTMLTVRQEQKTYWEVVEVMTEKGIKKYYDYYVILRINKDALRGTEKIFLLQEKRISQLKNKTYLEQSFERCLGKFNELMTEDETRVVSLKKDLSIFN